jgi:hypothetical protein
MHPPIHWQFWVQILLGKERLTGHLLFIENSRKEVWKSAFILFFSKFQVEVKAFFLKNTHIQLTVDCDSIFATLGFLQKIDSGLVQICLNAELICISITRNQMSY